jgi:hypothetical protein
MSKTSLKMLENSKRIFSKTENNHQEVSLKLSVCLLSFGPQMDPCGPQMDPCGPQKMVSGALVLGCMVCGPKLTICGP